MKYNLVYEGTIIVGTDKELDDHLKRHLKQYIESGKSLIWVHKWLTERGFECEINSSTK